MKILLTLNLLVSAAILYFMIALDHENSLEIDKLSRKLTSICLSEPIWNGRMKSSPYCDIEKQP